MPIDPPDITTKVDSRTVDLPIENKVVAADINELVRCHEDTIDYLTSIVEAYTTLYVCEGTSPAQTITSGGKITIDQWEDAGPSKTLEANPGDNEIVISEPGIYDIRMNVSYETTARDGETFRVRLVDNGDPVPGICTVVQHRHPQTTRYNASAGRIVKYEEPKILRVEFEAGTLAQSRTVNITHAALTVQRIDLIDD